MEDKIDPVLRCCSCQKLVKVQTLHKIGTCPGCGNRRMSSLTVLNTGERKTLVEWGYYDFVTQFEAVEVDE